MIYDHIKNISLYKGLSPALDTGLEFIRHASKELSIGVSFLEYGVKVIVSEYATKLKNESGYEAHRKYIDIQFPVDGLESIKYCPIEYLDPSMSYNEENDYILYEEREGINLTIGNGYFMVLFPDDGHMPQLCVDKSETIKKVTLKIPVE